MLHYLMCMYCSDNIYLLMLLLFCLSVCICVTINGLCYWITTLVEHIQKATKIHKGSKVEVRFALSFYLIMTIDACVRTLIV